MELNVLVEAKKEYLSQLCSLMCPVMIQAFQDLYSEANKLSKGKRVLLQYQKLLKEVPNWNDHIVKQNSDNVCNSCSWFSDLLAAVFVSFVKILSSVRLKTDTKKISIKLPTNDLFVHTCYINAAKDLYKDPYIYDEEMNEHVRDSKLSTRFTACIEATIKELLPIQQILETYMKQQQGGESVDLNADEPVEDDEDPDIDENENEPGTEPEPDSGAEPEAGTEPSTQPGDAPPTEQTPGSPPVPGEVKNIPITGQAAQDDGVLFGDAPDEKTKVA
jgi:hypothetical protein